MKLRGFRIELGEIEAVLKECPALAQSVVVLREDRPGDKRLLGYDVPRESHSPTHVELIAHLRRKLPDYMLPSAFVPLERLPLTPNGKVDRQALPAPDPARPDLGMGYVLRSRLEEQLAAIWADLLGVERVGIHDNFFELGGHSLSATRVVSQIRSVVQVELPVRSLFETPTIAGLAETIEAAQCKPGQALTTPCGLFRVSETFRYRLPSSGCGSWSRSRAN